jgi:hypothetical protein
MTVIGINLNSISATVKNRVIKGNLNIGSTPNIKNVEKRNVLGMEVLAIEFGFETKYEPDIASISIEGELMYKTDDVKKILKKWKDDKKLPDDIAVDILNVIFRKCLTQSIVLSEEIGVPPPLGFPVVKPKDQKEEK